MLCDVIIVDDDHPRAVLKELCTICQQINFPFLWLDQDEDSNIQ